MEMLLVDSTLHSHYHSSRTAEEILSCPTKVDTDQEIFFLMTFYLSIG